MSALKGLDGEMIMSIWGRSENVFREGGICGMSMISTAYPRERMLKVDETV